MLGHDIRQPVAVIGCERGTGIGVERVIGQDGLDADQVSACGIATGNHRRSAKAVVGAVRCIGP